MLHRFKPSKSAKTLCSILSPEYAQSQTPPQTRFTSPAAIAALTKRGFTIAEAKRQYIASLKLALKGVMQGGQLEEANRINKAIENAGSTTEPFTSLSGKAAQVAYRSAIQRATNEYVAALKIALGQSMKAGQLDESNRISAEIKAVEEASEIAATTTPGNINLLSLIVPEKYTIEGSYVIEKSALIGSGKTQERIEIPYEVPEEYDFLTTFSVVDEKGVVVQILSGNGHPFIWAMNTSGAFTFHYLKGAGIGTNKTSVKVGGLKQNKRYTSLLKVRKTGVQAFLDGKLVSKWDTDFSDSTPAGFWALRNQKALGVGNTAKTVFHSIEVREVTGKGKTLKP